MSTTRRWTALTLAALTLPLMIMALIDPLEGALPFAAALILTLIVRIVSDVRIPRVELGGIMTATVVGVTAITLAAIASGAVPDGGSVYGGVTAANPLDTTARVLVWIYRAAVIVAAVGAVQYLLRLVQVLLEVPVARRAHRSTM